MVQQTCKVCQQTWDFRGGSSICSDECRTEWVHNLRPRAYTKIITPHREHYQLVTKDVEVGMATQKQKHAALKNLEGARDLYSAFLASLNPRQFLEDLI